MLSTNATFLYVGAAIRDVLGWGAGEVMGKPLADFVTDLPPQEVRMAVDAEMTKVLADAGGSESAGLACNVHTKDQGTVPVHIVLYRSRPPAGHERCPSGGSDVMVGNGGDFAAHAPVVCQVKLCEGTTPPSTLAPVHPPEESIFEETKIDRSSSWQYELQQLKYRNQRLIEEIMQLEAAITKKIRRKQSMAAMPPSSSSAVPAIGLGISATARAAAAARLPIAYQHPASGMQPAASFAAVAATERPLRLGQPSSTVLPPAPQVAVAAVSIPSTSQPQQPSQSQPQTHTYAHVQTHPQTHPQAHPPSHPHPQSQAQAQPQQHQQQLQHQPSTQYQHRSQHQRGNASLQVPIAAPRPIAVSGERSPTGKMFTPFRLLSKKHRTVSAASVEAVEGTVINAMLTGGDSTRSSTVGRPSPPLRDPLTAAYEWRNREEYDQQLRGTVRRRRPGVTFDIGEEVPEDGRAPVQKSFKANLEEYEATLVPVQPSRQATA
ncbi:hypothetical protein NUW54_g5720 [Trametes sanguinea]|uniref:Uncharacterized protein n=1 Tax=Trametes sanguinea TaxID=158606 RepID=A0ACC1PUT9_9APHY|nr:hypothetical protein NUW54_g5720 [Trametes sanguinea]